MTRVLECLGGAVLAFAYMYVLIWRHYRDGGKYAVSAEPKEPEPEGMWMYVDCPAEGVTRRCWATPDPVSGLPVTPPLSDPAWKVAS